MRMRWRDFTKRIGWGRYDKTVHLTASVLLVFILFFLIGGMMAVLLTLALGVVKEIRDAYRPGDRFDFYDLITDGMGVAIGWAAAYTVEQSGVFEKFFV